VAKKSIRLIDEITTLERAPAKRDTWVTRLQRKSPEAHAEIMEAVRDFANYGKAFDVFKQTNLLKQFISESFGKRGLPDPLASVRDDAFRKLILETRRQANVQ
jgi:hypothetical protein